MRVTLVFTHGNPIPWATPQQDDSWHERLRWWILRKLGGKA